MTDSILVKRTDKARTSLHRGKPLLPTRREWNPTTKGRFPLTPRTDGRWQKRISQRAYYFTGDWREALKELNHVLTEIKAGRDPLDAIKSEAVTLFEVCDRFIIDRKQRQKEGLLTQRSLDDYERVVTRLRKVFGDETPAELIGPADFARLRETISRTRGIVALGNEIQRVRSVFRFAEAAGLVNRNSINFGPAFRKPTKRELRKHRQASQQLNGKRLFSQSQILAMLDAADSQMRAMILLGINCGLGNSDLGQLTVGNLDLDSRWLDYPRPKTGIERRCPLWPETVDAIREVLKERERGAKSKLKRDSLVFLTATGLPWHRDKSDSPISKKFGDLLRSIDKTAEAQALERKFPVPEKLKRNGVNFYALRHTFATIGAGTRDQVAANYLMGHADHSMAAIYRETIDDSRFVAITEFVRAWLFNEKSDAE